MSRTIKRNIEKNNVKQKKKGSVAKKVIATTLVLGTLAGATAVVATNENVQTWLGIGSEHLESNNNEDNSQLQTQIDILKIEKAELQSRLDEYKERLSQEKDLTAEQLAHIAELESAIAEKETNISQLESLVKELQNKVDVLEEQIGSVTNSVMDKLNTYTMKYDNNTITNVFKKDNYVFISSNYSIEIVDTVSGEQRSIYTNTSGGKFYFYDINDTIYIANPYTFGKFNTQTMEYEAIENSTSSNVYNKLSGDLIYIKNLEDGRIIVKTSACIGVLNTDGNWEIYKYLACKEFDGVEYIVGPDANKSININISRIEIDGTLTNIYNLSKSSVSSFYTFQIFNDYIYCSYNASSNSSNAKFERINIDTGESTTLLTGSTVLYNFEMIAHNDVLFFYKPNCAYTYKLDLESEAFTKLALVSNTSYSELVEINGYIFDKSLSYVYNDSTGEFQLTTSSASSSAKDYYVVDGWIIKNGGFFDSESLTFKNFNYENTKYSAYNSNIQNVNGKLFFSSSSMSTQTGVCYLDIETKTIKKVPDSGNGDLLNDNGYGFEKSISISDSYALIYGDRSSQKYAVLINTDTMMVENVFSNFYNDVIKYNDKIISGYGNYVKILDINAFELNTIYSKESVSDLTISFTENDKVYLTKSAASYAISIDLKDSSIDYIYGVGGINISGLKFGYHSASATLFDPKTGDVLNIRGNNASTIDVFNFENSEMFINSTIVYEVLK